MDYAKADKLLRLSKAGGTDKDLIFLDELEEISDSLKNLKIDESKVPDLQKVEVINFPEQKDIPAPVINVPAPIVNVETPIVNVPAPIVNVNPTPVNIDTANLLKSIDKLYDKDILKDVINDGRVKVEVDRVGYGGVVTFPIVEAIKTGPTMYTTQIDDVSTSGVTYLGRATIGSSTSSAIWQIQKIDESGTPITTVITWADGNSNFDNVWSNRTSLTYT